MRPQTTPPAPLRAAEVVRIGTVRSAIVQVGQVRHFQLGVGAAVAIGAILHAAGCGSSKSNNTYDVPEGGASSGGEGGLVGDDGPSSFGDGGGTACTGTHCSSDLHSVVDCNGNVVSTCPADQGCAASGCVERLPGGRGRTRASLGCELLRGRPGHHHRARRRRGRLLRRVHRQHVGHAADRRRRLRRLDARPLDLRLPAQGLRPEHHLHAALGRGHPAPARSRSSSSRTSRTPAPDRGSDHLPVERHAGHHEPRRRDARHRHRHRVPHPHDRARSSRTTSSRTAAARARSRAPRCSCRRRRGTRTTSPSTAIGHGARPHRRAVHRDRRAAGRDAGHHQAGRRHRGRHGRRGRRRRGRRRRTPLNKGQILQFTQDAPLDGSILQSNKPDRPLGRQDGAQHRRRAATTPRTSRSRPCARSAASTSASATATATAAPRSRRRGASSAPSTARRSRGSRRRRAARRRRSSLGQVAQFDSTGPFVVQSQDASHPFYVSAHMTGARQYDPEPAAAAATAAATPSSSTSSRPASTCRRTSSSPTRPTRRRTSSWCARRRTARFEDVTLDCAGDAHRLAAGRQRRALRVHAHRSRHRQLPGHRQLRQRAARDQEQRRPFGVTVWGWGSRGDGRLRSPASTRST